MAGGRYDTSATPSGGGEDRWLCDPGFSRVCPYRGMRWSNDTLRSGTGAVNRPEIARLKSHCLSVAEARAGIKPLSRGLER